MVPPTGSTSVLLYLTFWFPKAYLGRLTAIFFSAAVVALVIGGPLAGLIFQLDGVAALHGWQWLFLVEGAPACLIGLAALKFLPDRPTKASWLDDEEKFFIATHLQADDAAKNKDLVGALRDPRVLLLSLAYGGTQMSALGFALWLPQMVQSIGFSITETGWLLAAIYSAAVPATVLWGRSSDAKGDRIWHFVLAALFVAGALIVASVAQGQILLLALAAAEFAIPASSAMMVAIPALFLRGPAMASGIALFGTIGALLGGFGGQYLIGVIRELSGGYSAVLLTIAAWMVMSALIVAALSSAIVQRANAASANTGGSA